MLDDGRAVLACSECYEDDDVYLKLTVCKNDSFYEGIIQSDGIETMARYARMTLESYKNEINNAFMSSRGGNDHDYMFSLTKKLTWKKYLPGEDLKINLGCIEMREVEVPASMFSTVSKVLATVRSHQDEIDKRERHQNEMQSELKTATEELSRLADIKSTIETDLYTKFSRVLNEKKAKIRDLKSRLDDSTRSRPSTSIKSKTTEDDFGGSTDEDSMEENVSDANAADALDLSFGNTFEPEPEIVIRPRTKRKKTSQVTKTDLEECSVNAKAEPTSSPNADDLFDNL